MFLRHFWPIAVLASASLCNIAHSQTAQEGSTADVEEVLVYGTKQGLTLQQVTDSVELMSAERLADEVTFNVADAISRAVNTSVQGQSLGSIEVRGISRQGTGGAGQGAAVTIYLDGVPASAESLISGGQSLWDAQQLEVLRGSQSTVQGRNAIAGAVVVQSKLPSYEWEGAARALAAEYGTRQYAGAISGPLIEDELAFRLSVDDQDTDGYVDYAFDGADADFRNSTSTRAALLYEPTALPALRTYLIAQYVDREAGQSAGRITAPLPANDPDFLDFDPADYETFTPVLRSFDVENTRVTGDIRYVLSDAVTLKLLGTYEDVDQSRILGRRASSRFGAIGGLGDGTATTYTTELSLAFEFAQWTGIVGAYYFDATQDSSSVQTFTITDVLPLDINPVDSVASLAVMIGTRTKNAAAFTQWRFSPNEHWDFDMGLRFDSEEYETQRGETVADIAPDNCTITLFPGNPPIPCDDVAPAFNRPGDPLQADEYDAWLPRASATYHLKPNVSVFAGVRRGYRAGGAGIGFNDDGEAVVYTYEPEFLTSYEAGWRSEWMAGRLLFNGTAFYSDYEDQQVNVDDSLGFTVTTNAGETSLYGLEMSSTFIMTDAWRVYGNLGLLQTEIEAFILDGSTEPPVDLKGNELDDAPPVTLTAGVVYAPKSGLFGSVSLNYRSASYSDIFNLGSAELGPGISERVESAYLVNARLGYRLNGITLTGFVTNLLDEDSPESYNLADGGVLTGNGGFRSEGEYNLRQPQTFGVSLEYAF